LGGTAMITRPLSISPNPLTPALSPNGGEGEEARLQRQAHKNVPQFSDPLAPTGGEGQGEGVVENRLKAGHRSPHLAFQSAIRNPQSAIN
jgi:hypothetical protein